ncbi:MAG: single-stranded-DNA-specific exonuclease RecJ [Fusobacteria bacterium]|nr:single-stranded-DNA-specific exonuclease RecJ [Fusobacteriota bacterium]
MSYICDRCGEMIKDNELCTCLISEKKEALKKRNKKYYLRKKFTDNLTANILKSREIKEEINEFLSIDFNKISEDKYLNQEIAADIIYNKIKENKLIGIYGDYDADGITGTAVGYNIIKALGGRVTYYINDRFKEGFGICVSGVEKLAAEKTDLIITVDNGISGVEGVKKAKELGIEVIITDHHEPNEELPDALIIDPKQKNCPSKNKEITGVGVLFKILLEVCKKFNKEVIAKKEMDLVALGTVADMGPLTGENRTIVKAGLMIWNLDKGKSGIKRLIEKIGINKEISTYELGYVIAPILNAESRLMGRPEKSIRLLTNKNTDLIDKDIDYLIEINDKRKSMVEEQIGIGDQLIDPDKYLFFIYDQRITEGIAGLIASRLMETYRRPTIVLGKTREGFYKGSGRSTAKFNLKKALDKNSKLLLNYGGHNLACGLSVNEDNISLVKSFLETEGKMLLEKENNDEKIIIDWQLQTEDINKKTVDELCSLEPFGIGFNKPVFIVKNIDIKNISVLKEIHSKFNYQGVDFIAFNQLLQRGRYHVIGFPQINKYNGRENYQFLIREVIAEDTEICELET